MKKSYLFFAIYCMATNLLAQSQPVLDLHKKLSQNIEQLTPANLRSEISQFNDQMNLVPPGLALSYNLTDSTYGYIWNSFLNNWTAVRKTMFENDCTIGKPTTTLEQVDNLGSGTFVNYRKTLNQYFDDGNDQIIESYYWHPIQQSWEQSDYSSNVRPYEPMEVWSKSWDESTYSFTDGSRTVYNYNSSDKLDLTEAYEWDIISNNWGLVFRTKYTYINGLNTEQLGESYDAASNTWTLTSVLI
jgi:hypothetical protein